MRDWVGHFWSVRTATTIRDFGGSFFFGTLFPGDVFYVDDTAPERPGWVWGYAAGRGYEGPGWVAKMHLGDRPVEHPEGHAGARNRRRAFNLKWAASHRPVSHLEARRCAGKLDELRTCYRSFKGERRIRRECFMDESSGPPVLPGPPHFRKVRIESGKTAPLYYNFDLAASYFVGDPARDLGNKDKVLWRYTASYTQGIFAVDYVRPGGGAGDGQWGFIVRDGNFTIRDVEG
jgi:hypothetical protein